MLLPSSAIPNHHCQCINQLRKSGCLFNEWREAFDTKRFVQINGRPNNETSRQKQQHGPLFQRNKPVDIAPETDLMDEDEYGTDEEKHEGVPGRASEGEPTTTTTMTMMMGEPTTTVMKPEMDPAFGEHVAAAYIMLSLSSRAGPPVTNFRRL